MLDFIIGQSINFLIFIHVYILVGLFVYLINYDFSIKCGKMFLHEIYKRNLRPRAWLCVVLVPFFLLFGFAYFLTEKLQKN